jgi:hypothetical protein
MSDTWSTWLQGETVTSLGDWMAAVEQESADNSRVLPAGGNIP